MLQKVDMMKLKKDRRSLILEICDGKAFCSKFTDINSFGVNHLATAQKRRNLIRFCLNFRGQRYSSASLSHVNEPEIFEKFSFDLLHHPDDIRILSPSELLKSTDLIHLVVVNENVEENESSLLSSTYIDWREVLSDKKNCIERQIELKGVNDELHLTNGLINIKLSLFPPIVIETTISAHQLQAQILVEKEHQSERIRLFHQYAEEWQEEFLQIRPSHSSRHLRILSVDENGKCWSVCRWIRPRPSPRILRSSGEAVRFVSLLKLDNKEKKMLGMPMNGEKRNWNSPFATLSLKSGNVEEHSLILTSLLLGLGMNAFTALGTLNDGTYHCWVVTIIEQTDKFEVTFWESTNGESVRHFPIDSSLSSHLGPYDQMKNGLLSTTTTKQHQYLTIDSLFNHRSFYANISKNNCLEFQHFNLNDERQWKQMSNKVLFTVLNNRSSSSVSSFNLPPLEMGTFSGSANKQSDLMEMELKEQIQNYRRAINLTTKWDDEISLLLEQAINTYENERKGFNVEEMIVTFNRMLRNRIPANHSFKAFPVQFIHTNTSQMLFFCKKNQLCETILHTTGDQVYHSLRAQVYRHPECIKAVWLIIACRVLTVD
ncbi:hypothetical protein SNEBB_005761 [Seison nebaliae]|nr:hypothetical protein SNEBB_005761 [Seison nebaliae]